MRPHAIESWHKVMVSGDVSALPELLHDDAVFHSPVVHTPQMGKAKVMMYLSAAATVFDDTQFTIRARSSAKTTPCSNLQVWLKASKLTVWTSSPGMKTAKLPISKSWCDRSKR